MRALSTRALPDNTFHIEANNYFWVEYFGGQANLASNLTEAYKRLGYENDDARVQGDSLAARAMATASIAKASSHSSNDFATDTNIPLDIPDIPSDPASIGTDSISTMSNACKNQSYSCTALTTDPTADGQLKRKDVDADTAMLMATGWNHQQVGFAQRGANGNSSSPKFVVVKAEDVWDPDKCPSTLALILNRTGMEYYTKKEESQGIECGDDSSWKPEPMAALGPMSISDLTAVVAPALQLLDYDLSAFFRS